MLKRPQFFPTRGSWKVLRSSGKDEENPTVWGGQRSALQEGKPRQTAMVVAARRVRGKGRLSTVTDIEVGPD